MRENQTKKKKKREGYATQVYDLSLLGAGIPGIPAKFSLFFHGKAPAVIHGFVHVCACVSSI